MTGLEAPSKGMRIGGIVLTTLVTLLLLASATGKFVGGAEFEASTAKIGIPAGLRIPLGVVESLCAIVYAIPRTSFLGAILVTGYMGGAILTHLRIGEPWFVQVLVGVVAWLGYGLRNPGVIRAAFR